MNKLLAYALTILCLLPTSLMAKKPKAFRDKTLYQNQCGQFVLVSNAAELESGPCFNMVEAPHHSTRKEINHRDTWTSNSVTEVVVPRALKESYKSTQDVIDAIVVTHLEERVRRNLKEAMSIAEEDGDTELSKELKRLQKIVFEKGNDNPRNQVRKYLTLFPGLKEQMLKEDPDLAAVFCQYDVWRERQEQWQRAQDIIDRVANWGGLTGAAVAAVIAVPVLPAVLVGISVLKLTSSAMTVRDQVARVSDRQAGRAAKLMLEQEEELEDELKILNRQLRKSEDPNEQRQLSLHIKETEEALREFAPYREGFLKARAERRELNRELIGGAVNTVIGVSTFRGGRILSQRLKGFRSEVPDSVIPVNTTPIGGDQNPGNVGSDG